MHSSNCLGLAPFNLALLLLKNFIRPSNLYSFAVQYAVTRGNLSLSDLPSLAASRLAVGSLIRVNCEYTSLPLSSSTPSSPTSGFGRSFSFCAVLVVRCGPILDADAEVGCVIRGEPWLFRLRSLPLSVDSLGWEVVGGCCGFEKLFVETGAERRGPESLAGLFGLLIII